MFSNHPFSCILPKWCCSALIVVCFAAFKADELIHKLAQQTQQKLSSFHDVEPGSMKIRKCEITISDEGFLRYRKIYLSGKQEYYSLNLSRLRSIDYFGSTDAGHLSIRTMEDDVIVQTYNDRSGNVDSMSVQLNITLNAIEPEDLENLQRDMFEIKRLINQ